MKRVGDERNRRKTTARRQYEIDGHFLQPKSEAPRKLFAVLSEKASQIKFPVFE
jgi:hypothetical protein